MAAGPRRWRRKVGRESRWWEIGHIRHVGHIGRWNTIHPWEWREGHISIVEVWGRNHAWSSGRHEWWYRHT